MRRLLFLLILVCLPLQSIWAAAASYCGHEAPAAAMHFGHHQHPEMALARAVIAGMSRMSVAFILHFQPVRREGLGQTLSNLILNPHFSPAPPSLWRTNP